MKNHRIGNDINVKWSIFSEGAPYNLEGLQVTLYLKDSLGKRAVTGFSLQENNVLWRFAGKDQSHTGRYSLELVVNEGKTSMITTDICNFVNLVQHSCMIGGSDAGNIETDSISLTSDLGSVPVIIDESLSEVSENAIANKTVTKELKKKVNKTDLATINGQSITEGGNIVIQGSGSNPDLSEYAKKTEVAMSLAKKVDKEEGKGLSSNDFTTTEKNKLASLANYNDSELRTEINKKQDALISGTNIKTINGQSILGEGNITIEGGSGNSYDDTEIKNQLSELEIEVSEKLESEDVASTEPTAEFPQLLYTPQTLTEAQKAQARENIGVTSGNSYDDTEIRQELTELSAEVGKKQDTISDLETIRSGATKGATALQSVPATYATKTDVSNAIQTAITNELNSDF